MSQNNPSSFFGVIISAEIIDNRELSLTDKFVYSYIASYSKYCAEPNAKIANRLGIGMRSVIRSVQRLKELGFVEVVFGVHSVRKIYITDANPCAITCGKVVENMVEKPVKNSKRCAKMATLKTGKGMPEWHTKNKKNK